MLKEFQSRSRTNRTFDMVKIEYTSLEALYIREKFCPLFFHDAEVIETMYTIGGCCEGTSVEFIRLLE